MKKQRKGKALQDQSANPFRDVYGLADLYPLIGTREPASGAVLKYGMYFGKGRAPIATLELKKEHMPDGRIVVDAVYDKTMHAEDETKPLTVHSVTKAAFQFDKSLTAAKAWSLKRAFYAQDGSVVPGTAVEKTVSTGDGSLRIGTGGKTRQIRLKSPAIPGYALFLIFEALPRNGTPFRFTLVEDGDNVKEDQQILYARTLERQWNGKPLKLYEYHHIGAGIMPQIYWTDENGRMLFSWTALTSYVLQ